MPPQFVVSLLNDLFGLQTRAGCQCAALFGQKILGVDLKLSREFKEALFDGQEVLRVGFTRFNLNYFLNDEEVEYILNAIEFVTKYGWLLFPHYQFEAETGYWVNREEKEVRVRSWLGAIDYSHGQMLYPTSDSDSASSFHRLPSAHSVSLPSHLDQAYLTLLQVLDHYKDLYGKSELDQTLLIPEEHRKLLWFTLPSEVLQLI